MMLKFRTSLVNLKLKVSLGIRRLIRTPGSTLIGVLSLGLVIGTNIAIFSRIRESVLHPLAISNPGELISIFGTDTLTSEELGVSRLNFADLKQRTRNIFSETLAYFYLPMLVDTGKNPERVRGALVTGNYFRMLGIVPEGGRDFRPDEDSVPGANPVALITDGFWTSHFGRDRSIIGKTMLVNKHPFVIIGILPSKFTGTELGLPPDIWIPMNMYAQADSDPDWYDARRAFALSALGRLRSGVSLSNAKAAVAAIGAQLASQYPEDNRNRSFTLTPFLTARLNINDGSLVYTLYILNLVMGMILAIGCSNVTLQMLARITRRSQTMAIQRALGATQLDVGLEWVTEVMLLCLAGGLVGVILGFFSSKMLVGLMPVPVATNGFYVDSGAIGIAFIVALLCTMFCGLIPLMCVPKVNVVESMKQQVSTWRSHRRFPSIKKILILSQIALCIVPLVNAGLLVRTLENAWSLDPGFRRDHILMVRVDPGLAGYDEKRGQNFYERIIRETESLPGVQKSVIVRHRPLEAGVYRTVFMEGQDARQGNNGLLVRTNVVSDGYFDSLGIRTLRGRDFTDSDRSDTPRVVIINERMAQTYWPGEIAVGKRLRLFGDHEFREVVGVVANSKLGSMMEVPTPMIYLPLRQFYISAASLFVRTSSAPNNYAEAVQSLIKKMDSSVYGFDVRDIDSQIAESLSEPTRLCTLLSWLGFLGLILAAGGIYGVASYIVADKSRDIGIRLALGAHQGQIIGMLLASTIAPVLFGACIGTLAALLVSRAISASLFGVNEADPVTYVGAIAVVSITALLACVGPALRAVRIDPVEAMRVE